MKIQAQEKERGSLAVSYALTVSGEAAQAAFHLLLNILLIREFLARDYGVFAVIFTVGAIAILNVSAVFGQPITVFISRSRGFSALALEVTMGSMAFLTCTLFSGAVAITAAYGLGDPLAGALAGGFAGLWPLRIYVKSVNFALHGKSGALRSTLSDVSYAVASAISLAALHFGFGIALSLSSVFLSLCVGNVVGILICLSGRGRPIQLCFRRRTFSSFAKMWPDIRWSLIATVANTLLGQSQMALVTILAGPAAYAPLAAGFVLMSPIRIMSIAVLNIMRPDLSRSTARGDHRSASAIFIKTAATLAAVYFSYGLALWLGWSIAEPLLYAKRFSTQPMGEIVILAWMLTSIGNATTLLQASALARSRFREAAWPTLAGGVLTVVLVPACLLAFGPALSTSGAIIGEIATVALLWTRRASFPVVARSATGDATAFPSIT